MTNSVSSRVRSRIPTTRTIDSHALNVINERILNAKDRAWELIAAFRNAENNFEKSVREYDVWKASFPYRDKDPLLLYCERKSQPVVQYYKTLFLEEKGDNCYLRKAIMACKLFIRFIWKKKRMIYTPYIIYVTNWFIFVTLTSQLIFFPISKKRYQQ